MPNAIHLKLEDLDTVEKRGKYTICIIGCGQTGVNYSLAFLEAGFKVVCSDSDQSVVRRLSRGRLAISDRTTEARLKRFVRTERLSFTSDTKSAVSQSDIIFLTNSVKIDVKKNTDYLEIVTDCKKVGNALRQGVLVTYAGVASFGLLEGIVKETLENTSGLKTGEGFGLAYNPIFLFGRTRPIESFSNKELVVAADDKNSLNSATIVMATLTRKPLRQILGFKTAELAALFAVARRNVNVALSNELAILCQKTNTDIFETLDILNVGFREMNYAPTVMEDGWLDELYLLLDAADNLNIKLKLTSVARQINETMPRTAVGLVENALRSCGKTLRRSKVALLGTLLGTTKASTSDKDFVKMLEAKGAKISLYDPLLLRSDISDMKPAPKRSLNEAAESSDCIVILNANPEFNSENLKNLKAIMKSPAAIVDLTREIEPAEFEKEGFIYRGLGRGSERK